jgi:hypothetical protein
MAWYYQKAARCGRLARQATDPAVRDDQLENQKLWRDIAAKESKGRKISALQKMRLSYPLGNRLH